MDSPHTCLLCWILDWLRHFRSHTFPADGITLIQDLATLPSFIADGNIATLLKGSDSNAILLDALRKNEYVFTWQNHPYFLGSLLMHGNIPFMCLCDMI
jgi:hypothetical protein